MKLKDRLIISDELREILNNANVIFPDNRDELLEYLNNNDIYPGVHYRDNTEYQMYSYDHGKCPNSHRMSNRIISLPLHLQLTKEDVEKVVETVKNFCK